MAKGDYIKNTITEADLPVHAWHRFVLGYPPHLVRYFLERLQLSPQDGLIFDPFSGMGTTPVEARLQGWGVVGIDPHPLAVMVAQAKLDWGADGEELAVIGEKIVRLAKSLVDTWSRTGLNSAENWEKISVIPTSARDLLLSDSMGVQPMDQALALREAIDAFTPEGNRYRKHFLTALANVAVKNSNLGFGPGVYKKRSLEQADVIGDFAAKVGYMAVDLNELHRLVGDSHPAAHINLGDARDLSGVPEGARIAGVCTSPPYPNEHDYSRMPRLELVLTGLLRDKDELRAIKERILRSNSRNIWKGDQDELAVAHIQSVQDIRAEVEKRLAERLAEKGRVSGFEKVYPRIAPNFFGGLARHLDCLREKLLPGATLAYVVGDQATHFGVLIKTADVMADIARDLGYRVDGIEVWRGRNATANRTVVDENILWLRWQG